MRQFLKAILLISAMASGSTVTAQVVRSGAGATTTTERDNFRADLGGGIAAGANGSFGGLRREINWDGVPAASSAPNAFPANFFNVNSPRGVVFSTPGTGFQVSGAAADAGAGQPAAANFGNIDASYAATFTTFSAQRLFTAIGSNVVDVNFFLPGTTTAALVSGFGSIFSDVDLANTTSLQLFDAGGGSLGTFFAPNVAGANGSLSFLGVSYATPVISRVRITSGNAALGAGVTDQNGNARDLVVMDDFIYAEPFAVPEPAAWALMIAGFALVGGRVRKARVALA